MNYSLYVSGLIVFGLFYNLYNNAWELLFSLFEGDIKKSLQIHIALLQQINCSML